MWFWFKSAWSWVVSFNIYLKKLPACSPLLKEELIY